VLINAIFPPFDPNPPEPKTVEGRDAANCLGVVGTKAVVSTAAPVVLSVVNTTRKKPPAAILARVEKKYILSKWSQQQIHIEESN
jgi:hypothetical protein